MASIIPTPRSGDAQNSIQNVRILTLRSVLLMKKLPTTSDVSISGLVRRVDYCGRCSLLSLSLRWTD